MRGLLLRFLGPPTGHVSGNHSLVLCDPVLTYCIVDNITPYCAEFVNTVTNVIFIHLGIMGIRDCLRYGHDRVFIISYLGYIIVGLGSMLFHATLKCASASGWSCTCPLTPWPHTDDLSLSRLNAARR